MLGVVSGVGFLIHLFASWYMRGEEGYSRFFAYMNLFVASMLLLVLADDLVILFFGWEGVGLCSYLLIGFYYRDPKNGAAAMKAFIVTRVGDVLMLIGLFILFQEFGTLHIQTLLESGAHSRPPGSTTTGGTDATGRRRRKIRTDTITNLVGGCHGRPHAGVCLDSCCHHGDSGCLPHRTYAYLV